MKLERSSGVLLHITSLPGAYGIGTLGPEARWFADILARAGMKYWQILPIGPVEEALGYSPYSSASTFAGNWLFISLELLFKEAWFKGGKASLPVPLPEDHFVSFPDVIKHKLPILESACDMFFTCAEPADRQQYEHFCKEEAYWLDDFTLFTALSEKFKTDDWTTWPEDISLREPKALAKWRTLLERQIRFHTFAQYLFFKQWDLLKKYCNELGIQIIGDIPIYIIQEGADTWSNPDILVLDEKTSKPLLVAGVPPDYFSDTGQRWGNPLYRWKKGNALSSETFHWWSKRIAHLHRLVDLIRIDHFRAFESYWAIPAEEKTAVRGKWIKGPGIQFFKKLHDELGHLHLIAEDLGIITPGVEQLRDDLGLPGMRILQFAFDFNSKNYYLPHNIDNPNCILYTGTHDNNTTNGWYYGNEINDDTRRYVLEYLGVDDWSDLHWKLIRQAYRTVANLVIIPAQDILGFGPEFRMNTPGTTYGNWRWKLVAKSISDETVLRLRRMGQIYDRIRNKQ